MKKSNILIISATLIALIWTILIGWFASAAIINYLNGKDPYYARSFRKIMESHKKTFITPSQEVLLSGEGGATVDVVPGKELTVIYNSYIWDVTYTTQKGGMGIIRFKKLRNFDSPITVTFPKVSKLSFYNFSGVKVSDLDLQKLHIQGNRISNFTADSCKTGSLTLNFPGYVDHQDICIKQSNKIDTLIASIFGSGKFKLETTGISKNQISLQNSINLEATSDQMKKIFK
ncbi:MAG: hypothetical protein ABSD71_02375 [Bacteroidales bacterium]|jgi:hypothetical protein